MVEAIGEKAIGEEKKDLDEAVKEEYKGICMIWAMMWGSGTEAQIVSWKAGAAKLK